MPPHILMSSDHILFCPTPHSDCVQGSDVSLTASKGETLGSLKWRGVGEEWIGLSNVHSLGHFEHVMEG